MKKIFMFLLALSFGFLPAYGAGAGAGSAVGGTSPQDVALRKTKASLKNAERSLRDTQNSKENEGNYLYVGSFSVIDIFNSLPEDGEKHRLPKNADELERTLDRLNMLEEMPHHILSCVEYEAYKPDLVGGKVEKISNQELIKEGEDPIGYVLINFLNCFQIFQKIDFLKYFTSCKELLNAIYESPNIPIDSIIYVSEKVTLENFELIIKEIFNPNIETEKVKTIIKRIIKENSGYKEGDEEKLTSEINNFFTDFKDSGKKRELTAELDFLSELKGKIDLLKKYKNSSMIKSIDDIYKKYSEEPSDYNPGITLMHIVHSYNKEGVPYTVFDALVLQDLKYVTTGSVYMPQSMALRSAYIASKAAKEIYNYSDCPYYHQMSYDHVSGNSRFGISTRQANDYEFVEILKTLNNITNVKNTEKGENTEKDEKTEKDVLYISNTFFSLNKKEQDMKSEHEKCIDTLANFLLYLKGTLSEVGENPQKAQDASLLNEVSEFIKIAIMKSVKNPLLSERAEILEKLAQKYTSVLQRRDQTVKEFLDSIS